MLAGSPSTSASPSDRTRQDRESQTDLVARLQRDLPVDTGCPLRSVPWRESRSRRNVCASSPLPTTVMVAVVLRHLHVEDLEGRRGGAPDRVDALLGQTPDLPCALSVVDADAQVTVTPDVRPVPSKMARPTRTDGGPFFDRPLEVVGHAHRELGRGLGSDPGPHGLVADLAEGAERRSRGGLVGPVRGHRHEAPNREVGMVGDVLHEGEGLLGGNAALGRIQGGVDLDIYGPAAAPTRQDRLQLARPVGPSPARGTRRRGPQPGRPCCAGGGRCRAT